LQLLVAGAGTGKTRVLAARAAHLVQTGKARPEEVRHN
jgi:DNA helicase-2/ATP-dependent DNA helicase PcrA